MRHHKSTVRNGESSVWGARVLLATGVFRGTSLPVRATKRHMMLRANATPRKSPVADLQNARRVREWHSRRRHRKGAVVEGWRATLGRGCRRQGWAREPRLAPEIAALPRCLISAMDLDAVFTGSAPFQNFLTPRMVKISAVKSRTPHRQLCWISARIFPALWGPEM